MFYYMHNNNNYQCKMCWKKSLTFGVGSIQLSFRTIVFTQYMQRCFQSKCYYISVKLHRGSAFHLKRYGPVLSIPSLFSHTHTSSPKLSLPSPPTPSLPLSFSLSLSLPLPPSLSLSQRVIDVEAARRHREADLLKMEEQRRIERVKRTNLSYLPPFHAPSPFSLHHI